MEWKIQTEDSDCKIVLSELKRKTAHGETLLLDAEIGFTSPRVPKPISLRTSFEGNDIYSVWSPCIWGSRHLGPNWQKRTTSSRLCSGLPIHALVSLGGRNRMTAALSDAAVASEIRTGVIEENDRIDLEIRLFTLPQNAIGSYRVTVYLDLTDCRYEDALREAEAWWERDCGYACASVPERARLPMYSTWYSFHQHVSPDEILRQCRMAKALGMDSVIVDDGWQTEDASRGYAYCGDWEPAPSKIPDMKKLVDDVHALNMKMLLWFGVPFIGVHSKSYQRFSDMFLGIEYRNGEAAFGVLDPRYPEVRRHLTDLYTHAVRDWGLDGLKLDFIDSFRLYRDTPAEDKRRDTPSLEEGVDRLLDEVTRTLRAIDPQIMIELRQTYVGPHIRKYGNMLRVCDCPADALINRRASADLRLVSGKTAIHSDMLMWHPEDRVESAAIQVLSALFCIPQISVMLDRIPESHRKMLAFYLSFWRENRDVLLDGRFTAEDPESFYTLVSSARDGHLIALAYTDRVLTVQNLQKLSYINASGADRLALRFIDDGGIRPYRIFNCMGEAIREGEAPCCGLNDFDVPKAGMLQLG